MDAREALAKLKGSQSEKTDLFNYFIEKAQTQTLEDWEAVMLEALKKEFTQGKNVVQMSATVRGMSSAGV